MGSSFSSTFIRLVRSYVTINPQYSIEINLDGFIVQIGESDKVIPVFIQRSEEVFQRIFTEGSLGLGESYCEGLIEVKDQYYRYFVDIFVRVTYDLRLLLKLKPADIFLILKAKFNRTFSDRLDRSENINAHYSLSDWFEQDEDANAFYLQWLDARYIQYSCGKWDQGIRTLQEAQENKLYFYAQRLQIKSNDPGILADLGCGWGGCLFYMAEKFGIRCHGITLSTAQASYIKDEAIKRHLEHLVTVEVGDILLAQGRYDYVISIGVMEHISDYDFMYRRLAQILKPGGRALIHSIFHSEWFYKVDPFLSKFIFPGGSTPEIRSNLNIFKKYFKHVDRHDLPALSYPRTLLCWFDQFCKHEEQIRNLLAQKSKVKDLDYSIRIFKHYLTLTYCGLTDARGFVSNILVY
ncbi:MAG: class I SAM-dependent methyltransferase [Saprospiraceae bacterium]